MSAGVEKDGKQWWWQIVLQWSWLRFKAKTTIRTCTSWSFHQSTFFSLFWWASKFHLIEIQYWKHKVSLVTTNGIYSFHVKSVFMIDIKYVCNLLYSRFLRRLWNLRATTSLTITSSSLRHPCQPVRWTELKNNCSLNLPGFLHI